MRERDHRADRARHGVDEKPENGVVASRGGTLGDTDVAEGAHDQGGDGPTDPLEHWRDFGDRGDFFEIFVAAREDRLLHSLDVPRAHDGHELLSLALADLLGEVAVTLVDQSFFQRRHGLPEFIHQLTQYIFLLDAVEFFFAEFRVFEGAGRKGGNQHRLLPE